MTEQPPIQLIANLVVQGPQGRVLLARYNPSGETAEPDTAEPNTAKPDTEEPEADEAEVRWWLPAHELEPYQHPDDAARIAVEEIGGLVVESSELARVQSFRGRRGWHVSFDYLVTASGEPASGSVPAAWHSLDELPPTMHGNWERDTIQAVRG